jgi:hypothetical protein
MSVSKKDLPEPHQMEVEGSGNKQGENQSNNIGSVLLYLNGWKVDLKLMNDLWCAKGNLTPLELAIAVNLLINKTKEAEQPSTKPPDENKEIPQQSAQPETSGVGNMGDKPIEHPPLLFDKVVYLGRNNLIFSPGGVGKSLLSMKIARSNHIKRPAFILREDYNGNQIEKYRHLVGDSAIIVTMHNWKEMEQNIQQNEHKKANLEIVLQYINPNYRKVRNITDTVFAKMRLPRGEKTDNFTILTAIVNEVIDEGADLICLDSLNALLDGRSRIDRHSIERILQPLIGKDITFLLIHHTNAKGELYGGVNSFDAFDHVYRLNKMPDSTSTPGTSTLVLDEVKSRHSEELRIVFTRTHTNQDVTYELVSDEPLGDGSWVSQQPTNLNQKIKAAILGFEHDDIPFADLFRKLGGEEGKVSEKGLKNELKTLKDQGSITMTDGKTWGSIHRNHLPS